VEPGLNFSNVMLDITLPSPENSDMVVVDAGDQHMVSCSCIA
jgi:hypothetical protein